MAYDYITRINMLPRMTISRYQPPTPEHWDLSNLRQKWYWRGLHWFLRKLGGAYLDRIPESYPIQTVTIDQCQVQSIISESRKAMRLLWDREATTLIISPDALKKMIPELPREMISFNMEWPIGNGQHMRIAGLRVVVVPWIDGWALLPDLK